MDQLGINHSSEEFVRFSSINKHYWEELEKGRMNKETVLVQRFATLFSELKSPADPTLANQVFLDTLAADVVEIEGAYELCAMLHPGSKLGIITNGDAKTQHKRWARSRLKQFFNFFVVSDDVGVGKPHPEIFREALNQAALTEPNVLMIGDNFEADIIGAHQCGFDTCWISSSQPSGINLNVTPTFTVGSLNELAKLFPSHG